MGGARTAWDLALPVRMWVNTRGPARGAIFAGLGVILGLTSALGLGMKLQRVRDARASRARSAAMAHAAPGRVLAGDGAERQLPVAFDPLAR